MKTACYKIDGHGRARSVGVEDALAPSAAGVRSVWIDVESPSRIEAAGLLTRIGVDAVLVDQILETGHAARAFALDGGCFFELPIEITGHPAELRSVRFVCLNAVLVTLSDERFGSSVWVTPETASTLDWGDGSAPVVASTILIELSRRLREKSLGERRNLTALADRLDEDPESVSSREMAELKRCVFDLEAVSEERSAVLESLSSSNGIFGVPSEAAERLQTALLNTAATSRRLDRLDRRAEALQARIDAISQERINRRLSRLTIISAVFLPLTLIAGIYGMNFEFMPELGYRYAYPLTLAGMAAIAAGLLWWFRRGGWMD